MVQKPDSNKARLKRHRRVRSKISGTPERPRLCVFRSAKHIYAQLIDDLNGVTIVSASTMEKDFEGFGGNKDAAAAIGRILPSRRRKRNFRGCFRPQRLYLSRRINELRREPARAASNYNGEGYN
jgi:ribosomal protein L18